MKKFTQEYSYLLYESLQDKVQNKISDQYASLKRGVLDLLENSVTDFDNLSNVEKFIKKYIEKPESKTLENFVEDGEIFDFYLKYQVDIDEICQKEGFFELIPQEQEIFSLYDFVLKGTQFAVIEIMKILQEEIFSEK